ncbi:hypothetical protein [Jannaschia rubra]|uniref:hypothetical protein n=1 Tax=Jannaschia rubra TaxID=282197 RepID=UPI00248F96A5|nr:hypothetical protein [Jannaschia rubra]
MAAGNLYRGILTGLGGVNLFAGSGMLAMLLGMGARPLDHLYVAALVGIGLILMWRALSPRSLTHPQGVSGGIFALLLLAVLGAASTLTGGLAGNLLEQGGMANGLLYGLVPGLLMLGLIVTMVLPVLVILIVRETAPATSEPALPASPRTALELTHIVLLRLTGIAGFLAAAFALATMVETPTQKAVFGSLGLIGSLTLLLPSLTPRFMARPSRLHHFIGFNLLATILAALPLLAYFIPLGSEVATRPQVDPVTGLVVVPDAWTFFMAANRITQVAMASVLIPIQLAWFTMLILLTRPPARSRTRPNDPARAIPAVEKRPVSLPTAKRGLPAVGAAMKLYVAADWIILRLLGLGLIGTAWMLWDAVKTGRTPQAAILAHGGEPMTAVYLYAGFGALLTVPLLLPRFIMSPRHVIGGLAKSILLVVAALILLTPLEIAMVTFTDKAFHATLIATVPKLFKAVTGVAVTSTLLIAFFRQLGNLPQVDYKGDPKIALSSQQLHELRKARMPG